MSSSSSSSSAIEVGDRVSRLSASMGDWPSVRYGTCVRVYDGAPNGLGETITLYAVRWDDTPSVIDEGYMRHGLTKLAVASAPTTVIPTFVVPTGTVEETYGRSKKRKN